MPSLSGLVGSAAAAGSLAQTLVGARASNPRATAVGGFDQHLDLALRQGIRRGADLDHAGLSLTPNTTSIEELRAKHDAALAEFEARLRQLLREHGIDVGDGMVLAADSLGGVHLVDEHPQKEAIERLFQDNPDLRNLFSQLDAQANLLRAAEHAAELARLQADAPHEAAAQVQQLLDSPSPVKYSFAVRPHEIREQFS